MFEELIFHWSVIAFPIFVYYYMQLEKCEKTDQWLKDKSVSTQIATGMFDILVAFLMAYAVTTPAVVIYSVIQSL